MFTYILDDNKHVRYQSCPKNDKKTCVFQVNVVFMAADHYDVEYDGM